MKRLEIDFILDQTEKAVEKHELAAGQYTRWTRRCEHPMCRVGLNPYACADAANILYVLGKFPLDEAMRGALVDAIQSLQDQKSGLFLSSTHHVIHTTAYCVKALRMLGAKERHPFAELAEYREVSKVFEMLEERDWLHCGLGAHPGAGLYTVFVYGGLAGAEWEERYFDWLAERCDPGSGFWKKEPVDDSFTVWQQLRDTANFLFNYEYARRPFPHPAALIDSCLDMYLMDQMPDDFGKRIRHFELDWVYCLNRASRQTAHRFEEIKEALSRFAESYIDVLTKADWNGRETDDLHNLFGMLCCLSELQQALPGRLKSGKPLRNILDLRPF